MARYFHAWIEKDAIKFWQYKMIIKLTNRL